jgi:hypothetical protein
MEHSVHIACKHFVEVVAPASLTTICKKVKAALQQAKKNGDLDLDSIDSELAELRINEWDDGNRDEEDRDITEKADEGFTTSNVLGKALALVKQV